MVNLPLPLPAEPPQRSTRPPTQPNAILRHSSPQAFSLIEVVLALGVLSFSFLVLFNMIPVGLGMMTNSIDTTVGSQIVQRITTIARQAKFTELSKLDRHPGTGSRGEIADYFFDDQGVEMDAARVMAGNYVYTAAVVLLPQSSVPGAGGVQIPNPQIATINIIIKKNEGTEILRTVNALIANNGL